jgi:hypothetical protein
MSNKASKSRDVPILNEAGKIVTDTAHVCTAFNDYFINIAGAINKQSSDLQTNDINTHPSIIAIKKNTLQLKTSILASAL